MLKLSEGIPHQIRYRTDRTSGTATEIIYTVPDGYTFIIRDIIISNLDTNNAQFSFEMLIDGYWYPVRYMAQALIRHFGFETCFVIVPPNTQIRVYIVGSGAGDDQSLVVSGVLIPTAEE